ncbi:hypothetical protein BBJ28_00023587, partial [Nothophytophthora sp. Chile5]
MCLAEWFRPPSACGVKRIRMQRARVLASATAIVVGFASAMQPWVAEASEQASRAWLPHSQHEPESVVVDLFLADVPDQVHIGTYKQVSEDLYIRQLTEVGVYFSLQYLPPRASGEETVERWRFRGYDCGNLGNGETKGVCSEFVIAELESDCDPEQQLLKDDFIQVPHVITRQSPVTERQLQFTVPTTVDPPTFATEIAYYGCDYSDANFNNGTNSYYYNAVTNSNYAGTSSNDNNAGANSNHAGSNSNHAGASSNDDGTGANSNDTGANSNYAGASSNDDDTSANSNHAVANSNSNDAGTNSNHAVANSNSNDAGSNSNHAGASSNDDDTGTNSNDTGTNANYAGASSNDDDTGANSNNAGTNSNNDDAVANSNYAGTRFNYSGTSSNYSGTSSNNCGPLHASSIVHDADTNTEYTNTYDDNDGSSRVDSESWDNFTGTDCNHADSYGNNGSNSGVNYPGTTTNQSDSSCNNIADINNKHAGSRIDNTDANHGHASPCLGFPGAGIDSTDANNNRADPRINNTGTDIRFSDEQHATPASSVAPTIQNKMGGQDVSASGQDGSNDESLEQTLIDVTTSLGPARDKTSQSANILVATAVTANIVGVAISIVTSGTSVVSTATSGVIASHGVLNVMSGGASASALRTAAPVVDLSALFMLLNYLQFIASGSHLSLPGAPHFFFDFTDSLGWCNFQPTGPTSQGGNGDSGPPPPDGEGDPSKIKLTSASSTNFTVADGDIISGVLAYAERVNIKPEELFTKTAIVFVSVVGGVAAVVATIYSLLRCLLRQRLELVIQRLDDLPRAKLLMRLVIQSCLSICLLSEYALSMTSSFQMRYNQQQHEGDHSAFAFATVALIVVCFGLIVLGVSKIWKKSAKELSHPDFKFAWGAYYKYYHHANRYFFVAKMGAEI